MAAQGRKDLGDNRVEIPLRMLEGNLDVLLEHQIHCQHIPLKYDPNSAGGSVLLMVGFGEGQAEIAHELGFRTKKP